MNKEEKRERLLNSIKELEAYVNHPYTYVGGKLTALDRAREQLKELYAEYKALGPVEKEWYTVTLYEEKRTWKNRGAPEIIITYEGNKKWTIKLAHDQAVGAFGKPELVMNKETNEPIMIKYLFQNSETGGPIMVVHKLKIVPAYPEEA